MKNLLFIFSFLHIIGLNAQNYTKSIAGQPTGSSTEVGITAGQLSVSLTGGATYQVPIAVPPGINGLMPQLSLAYNSQGGNGIAGYGWNLTGISAITRIPTTKFHDGFIDGVDFDDNDRIALDGQRLILKSGVYGKNGAIYETENYSNIKVVSKGDMGQPAAYFKVFYPDGSIAVFGGSVFHSNKNIWSIKKWFNTQDIRITYYYTKTNNSLYINRINYGKKGSDAALNTIEFTYKDRNRAEQAYINGISFKNTKILDEINVRGKNGDNFRAYSLEYSKSSLGYERLRKIIEKSGGKEYNPTLFFYENTDNPPNDDELFEITRTRLDIEVSDDNSINSLNTNYISGDFDGDAKMDIIIYPTKGSKSKREYRLFTNIADGGEDHAILHEVGKFEDMFSVSWLDDTNKLMNRQGWVIIQKEKNNYTFNVTEKTISTEGEPTISYKKTWSKTYKSSTSNSFDCEETDFYAIPQKFISGDFNGDGLTDVIAISKPYSRTICHKAEEPCDNGGPIFENNTEQDSIQNSRPPDEDCCECNTYTKSTAEVTFIDLNRNKTSDFTNYAGILLGTDLSSKENYDIQVGDFNGDGKSDFIIIQEDKIKVYSLDTNNKLITLADIPYDDDIDINKPHLLGDYNGDGKLDLMMPIYKNQDRWAFYFSKGNGFQKIITSIGKEYKESSVLVQSYYYYIPNDINNDGKTDILYIDGPRNTMEVLENMGADSQSISFNRVLTNSGFIPVKLPIPIFLNQNNLNQNLEFALLGGYSVFHLKYTKDHRDDMLLRTIGTGNGVVESIDYHPLAPNSTYPTDIYTYRPAYNETYPNVDLKTVPVIKVVSKLRKYSYNQSSKQLFSYHGAVSNVEGLGFLGFKTVLRTNWFHDGFDPIITVNKRDISKRGAVYESYTSKGLFFTFENTPHNYISKTVTDYSTTLSSNKVYKLQSNSSTSYNGLQNTAVTTAITYDDYNNPKMSTVVAKQSGTTQQTQITTLDYQHNPDGGSSLTNPYYIGFIKTKVVKINSSGDIFTTKERYKYSNALLLKQKKSKRNNTPFITENYIYDDFGNIKKKRIIAGGIGRTNTYKYDTTGRFLTKETDVEGLSTKYFYDPNGYLLKIINPFGLKTKYKYDTWGKKIREIDYLGNQTIINYSRTGGVNSQIEIINPDGSKGRKQFDDLGREIITSSYGLNDKWTSIKIDYDIYDRKVSVSEPYFGSASQYNTSEYDDYGRLKQTRNATGKTTDISYNGLTTTVTDGYKTISTTKNALGQVARMTDNGGTINYTYYAHGGLKRSTFNTAITTMEYDGWGRKTKLTDPSAGIYQYEYNAFGETTKEITPKGETTFILDTNGKVTQKIVQGDATDLQSTYTYNSTTKLLQNITANNGANYVYNYDNYKRLNKTTETNAHAIFERSTTFDNLGRPTTERYKVKNLSDSKTSDITIRNEYKNGSLYRILDNAGQSELWKINTINQRGQITNADLGNGITEQSEYDAYGLPTRIRSVKDDTDLIDLNFNFNAQRGILNSRSSNLYNYNETFQYDNLNRLTSFTNLSGSQESQSYDGKGRITYNTIGAYKYANSAKPYQNTSIDLSSAGTLYDYGKDLQNISYNAFKAPVHISANTSENSREEISFEYNIFQQRSTVAFKKFDPEETHYKTKHFSADGAIEITKNLETNTTEFVTYIGGNAYSTPIVYKNNGSSTEFLYLHRDYLGSIIAISNTQGTLIEKRHFDAWGKIALIKDADGNDLDKLTILDRGYTGHEHLESVDLVNMNARLYDANLHRFLAPDNFVQDPYNTQNYNRYSYVLNNPLSYVDPSGEVIGIAAILGGMLYGAMVGAAVSAVVYSASAIITGNWSLQGFGQSILYGAIGGAIGGGFSAAGSLLSSSAIASGGTGAFWQSTTFNVLSEFGSQVGSSLAMGDNITLGTALGSIAGGIVGGKLPKWSGTKGGWLKNAASEIGFNAIRGATRGAISGGIGATIDGKNVGQGIINGMKNGAIGGASQSLAMVAVFGATYKPTQQQLIYANRMAKAFSLSTNNVAWRRGGAYQGIMSLLNNKRDVTWGNNVATYGDTSSKTFGHEYGHIIQVSKQGWARFQAIGIFEQIKYSMFLWGLTNKNPYKIHGNNEKGANDYLRDYGY